MIVMSYFHLAFCDVTITRMRDYTTVNHTLLMLFWDLETPRITVKTCIEEVWWTLTNICFIQMSWQNQCCVFVLLDTPEKADVFMILMISLFSMLQSYLSLLWMRLRHMFENITSYFFAENNWNSPLKLMIYWSITTLKSRQL